MIRRVALLFAIGCSHPAPPQQPSPVVRADVKGAEDAELARKHDIARAKYQQAIADAQDPVSQAYARHELAETLISWGELAEAKAQLEAVVAAKPDDASAWHDLAMLRNHDGDAAGARAAFERAKELAPTDPRPRIALAAWLWCHDDRPAATSEYRGLLELDLPDRLRAKVRWALDVLAKPSATPPSCGPASHPPAPAPPP